MDLNLTPPHIAHVCNHHDEDNSENCDRNVEEICERNFSLIADDCNDDKHNSEDCDCTGGYDGK